MLRTWCPPKKTEEEQEELKPVIESEIQTYLTVVDLLEKKYEVDIDDYELPRLSV